MNRRRIAGVVVLLGVLTVAGFWWHLDHNWNVDVPNGVYHVFAAKPVVPTVAAASLVKRPAEITFAGNLAEPALREASGLVRSRRHAGVYWSVNDRGSPAEVFALDSNGRHLGRWLVDAPNFDFEEVAGFVGADGPMLLIADTGDNLRWRRELALHLIAEPPLDTPPHSTLPLHRTIRYAYPGGSYRDCEAVAVEGEWIYLVTKRVTPAEVFRLPLAAGPGLQTPERIALLASLPQPDSHSRKEDPEGWRFHSAPTALDMRGDLAVVLTHTDAYLYLRSVDEAWSTAFAGRPERVVLPAQTGLEAVAFTGGEGAPEFLTVAERFGTRNAVALFRTALGPMVAKGDGQR